MASDAKKIVLKENGQLEVPNFVVIPFIEGDGVGPDIWHASRLVFDAAVKKVSNGDRAIQWHEIFAGQKAYDLTNEWLPDATVQAIRDHHVAIKGPLATPVGGGIRSINVALRQILDLYACIRPVRHYRGVPSPSVHPEKVNMTIFRENTEDVYSGIEVAADTPEAKELAEAIRKITGKSVREGSAIGIKPISAFGSKRLVRRAIAYALESGAPSVTLAHKGNIMKFTEGGFRAWGYDVAAEEFSSRCVTEDQIFEQFAGTPPANKLVIKDRIADNMFQQIQTRPEDYSVIATTNLNGDYLSDALAAMVGGLGLAPGANIGEGEAVFEATHGTAPKYTGMDKVNPSSVILSGKMLFDHLGWTDVGSAIDRALEETIASKKVTYDLARGMSGAQELSCSKFAEVIISNL